MRRQTSAKRYNCSHTPLFGVSKTVDKNVLNTSLKLTTTNNNDDDDFGVSIDGQNQ